ncbi:MAG TPA: hypothetical protein VKG89_02255 [Solirubrobacterales bacterium]|nr:hypothetical protein [Solirubrobacterales bacterium]
MAIAGILPQTTGPYVALMIVGFFVGVLGHLSRSRWLVTIGIVIIFLAALALPLILNIQSNRPDPPGPLPRPY